MRNLEERLRNWGAWSRTGKSHPAGTSPLYSLMVANDPKMATRSLRIEPDERDALQIEYAIMRGCSGRDKEIFVLRYIRQMPDMKICQILRIHPYLLKNFLKIAFRHLELNLESLHNNIDNLNTT